MGQRCPCLVTQRNDISITKNLVSNEEEYKQLGKRAKAGLSVEISIDTNYYESKVSLLKIVQRRWIKIFFQNQVRNNLPKEAQDLYNQNLKLYTTNIIEKTENAMNEFLYSETKKPKKLLFYCKILLRQDGFYSGYLDINTIRNGEGFLITKDGKKFIGDWENNYLKGYGRLIDINGDFYEGVFDQNLLNGEGKYVSIDKEYCYEGTWINGKKHGKGKEETNVYIYEGDFENNIKQGNGKKYFKYIDEFYIGEFNDDEMTGKGIYICNNKDTFTGEFLKGKMHGKGFYKWGDGSEYRGEYLNNIKQGNGQYKTQCGKIYKGMFVNGKPHGLGTVEYNGKEKKVEFSEGKIVKKLKK